MNIIKISHNIIYNIPINRGFSPYSLLMNPPLRQVVGDDADLLWSAACGHVPDSAYKQARGLSLSPWIFCWTPMKTGEVPLGKTQGWCLIYVWCFGLHSVTVICFFWFWVPLEWTHPGVVGSILRFQNFVVTRCWLVKPPLWYIPFWMCQRHKLN